MIRIISLGSRLTASYGSATGAGRMAGDGAPNDDVTGIFDDANGGLYQ